MNTESVELSDFGQQLRELRTRAGLSRAELARAVRISESTVKALELGQRSPSSAVRSALWAALGQLDQAAESAAVLNCWIAPGFSPLAMLANVQATVNGPGGSLEQSALYLDPLGAASWCALVGNRDYHTRFGLTFPEAAAQIQTRTKGAALDVIALGCGDGRREVALTLALLDRSEQTPDLRLYLLDISQPLLSEAYLHAAANLDTRRGVSVTAVQGNFHDLPRYGQLLYRSPTSHRRRIVTLLGGTFANLDNELRWVSDALSGFGRGDLFLCDLTRSYSDDPIQLPQADPALRNGGEIAQDSPAADFFSGPVRRYHKGESSPLVTVRYELGPACVVPGSYQVNIVAETTRRGQASARWVVGRSRRYNVSKLGAAMKSIGWVLRGEVQQKEGSAPLSLCLFERT